MKMNDDDIRYALGRLEGKVDAILANQSILTNRLDEHDKRIGNLEMYKAWQLGASAVVASLVASCIAYFRGGN